MTIIKRNICDCIMVYIPWIFQKYLHFTRQNTLHVIEHLNMVKFETSCLLRYHWAYQSKRMLLLRMLGFLMQKWKEMGENEGMSMAASIPVHWSSFYCQGLRPLFSKPQSGVIASRLGMMLVGKWTEGERCGLLVKGMLSLGWNYFDLTWWEENTFVVLEMTVG